ncbi:hypothetical protein [Metabacillus sediminilitoris]|nr:hypothetical protein [Metabacillus sediminilitoris]QGQ45155.1 hypothetical protein GMB29_07705 [Metabacillus sediminilitoris]
MQRGREADHSYIDSRNDYIRAFNQRMASESKFGIHHSSDWRWTAVGRIK